MARPTYVNLPDTDVDIDSPQDTDLFDTLRDNIEASRICVLFIDEAEATTSVTSAGGAVLFSMLVFIPDLADYTGIDRTIYADFEGKLTGSAGTPLATFWLRDNETATDGSTVTESGTSYVVKALSLSVDSWKGTFRTIDLVAKINDGANSAEAKAENSNAWRLEY